MRGIRPIVLGLAVVATLEMPTEAAPARRSRRPAAVDEDEPARVGKPRGKPLAADALAKLQAQLTGDDEAAAVAAAKALGASGAPNAVDALNEVLAMGTTPGVAAEALAALEALKDARALQVLTLYAGNRNLPVRKAAVKALGVLPDERVVGTLLERLGDSAPEVRAVAAEALAARKDVRSVPRLFKLVEKNDAGAAGPLGSLVPPDEIPRLAELRGRIDDGVLSSALGEFLKRPEVSDQLRVDVVRTLGRIPGASATTALVEYLTTVPEGEARPSKDEAQKLVDSRGTP